VRGFAEALEKRHLVEQERKIGTEAGQEAEFAPRPRAAQYTGNMTAA
jgi:hypothetical protein